MEIQLDIAQKLAVETSSGAVMVLAGPGAGKTRVICHRIIRLVEEGQVNAGRIVAVTFTNRAADEMRRRLLDAGPEFEPVRIKTFHSFALDIVKRNFDKSPFSKKPVVFDEAVQNRVIRDILRRMGLSSEVFPIRRLKSVIDLAKANLSFPLASDRFPEDFEAELREILVEYQKALLAHNAMDFNDILLTALELLLIPEVCQAEREAIDYFLIDEFQDINLAQYFLISLVNPPADPIFAVADADQTIYNWRGSSSEFIGRFIDDYNPEIIHLENNWRCAAPIIQAARGLISHNIAGVRSKLPPLKNAEPRITLFELNDEAEESKLVLKLAENAIKSGTGLSGIAILGRTHYVLDNLHRELLLNGVPVVRISKDTDETDISRMMAYFEMTRSLHEWDVETATRFPIRCLTSLDEIRVLKEAQTGENGLLDVLKRSTRDPRIAPLSRKRISDLLDLIGGLPSAIEEEGLSMALHKVLKRVAASRSPLKPATRKRLREEIASVVLDPSVNIDDISDKLQKSKKVEIIFSPELHPLIAARIIAETLEGLFNKKVDLRPLGDGVAFISSKSFNIAIGLSPIELRSIAPDSLYTDFLCLSPGKIHSLVDGTSGLADDYRIALAAYALCYHLASPKLPDDDLEIVFLDLETTSIDVTRTEIVEIAAIRCLLSAGKTRELKTFHTLVKPSRPIPPGASAIHGITDEMVKDAPSIDEIIQPFTDFLDGAILAGHNIEGYDLPIIQRLAGRLLARDIPNPVLDTLPIARRLFPRVSHTLSDMARMLDIPLEDAHRAMDDTRAAKGLTGELLREEALDMGIDFSTPALNLLSASYLWDENAPDKMIDLLTEASARASIAEDGIISGFDNLAKAMNESYRRLLDELSSVILKKPLKFDEDDDRFESMRSGIEEEAFRFTEKNPDASIGDFLDFFSLLTDEDYVPEEEAVRLMSLHSAKGLEFNTVIITGMEQGNMPHYLALGHAERIEEERRLFYVGLTRASDKVYLTALRERDGTYRFPSMFLSELPPSLVKHLKTQKKK